MFHELSGTPLTHPPTVHENLAVTTGWVGSNFLTDLIWVTTSQIYHNLNSKQLFFNKYLECRYNDKNIETCIFLFLVVSSGTYGPDCPLLLLPGHTDGLQFSLFNFHVKHGLPRLRSPVGSSPRPGGLCLSALGVMVCPIHLHFQLWMVSVVGSWQFHTHRS